MRLVEFEPWHLEHLTLQEAQAFMGDWLTPAYGKSLKDAGPCFTGLRAGRPVGMAGLVICHSQRALTWALLGDTGPRVFLWVHRAVSEFLDRQPYRRIEATVDVDFPQGHRWVELLGFRLEAPRMRAFSPSGRDYALYARLRKEK